MMYVLEVIASVYGGPFSSAMKEVLLLEGNRGVSFISSHATIDTEHMARLRDILNHIEASEPQAAVLESVAVNFQLVTQVFGSI